METRAAVSEVFEILSTAWLDAVPRLIPYLTTGCSWEEWVNVEGWLALHAAGYDDVTPRAPYRSLPPGTRNRPLGDLLVGLPEVQVMVEVKTIHDWTYAKYAAQVDADPEKLQRETEAGRATLFVLILTSLDSTKPWVHLDRLRCWSRTTELCRAGPLGTSGQVEIRGWLSMPAERG